MPKIRTTTETVTPPATSGALIISEQTSDGDNCYLEPNSSGTTAIIPTEGQPFTWAFWAN